jgi:hypothetical protein
MRLALATTVLAMAVIAIPPATLAEAAIPPATLATAASRGPSRHQIATAIRGAERARSLWATINICSPRAHHDDLGVRGQMPALGFSASLSMLVQVDYWSTGENRFITVTGAKRTLALGNASSGLQQAGEVFGPFNAHAGLLGATIRFTWTRAGRVLGQALRRTTAGHPDADHGSPAHFSAAQCRIK